MAAQLTSILDRDELNFINSIISKQFWSLPYRGYWIGLKREFVCEKGSEPTPTKKCFSKWHWTDNSTIADIYLRQLDSYGYGDCVLIHNIYQLIQIDCNKLDSQFYPTSYICKKVISKVNGNHKPLTSKELWSAISTSPVITTVNVYVKYSTSRQDENTMYPNSIVIPVAVVLAVFVVMVVIAVSLIVVCKKRKASSERQPQSSEPNIYSVPPVTPSAPPLEIGYDNHTEDVRVQVGVPNPEYHREEENVSRNYSNVNTQDGHEYNSIKNTSGYTQNDDRRDDVSTTVLPGSGNKDEYAAVKKSRRYPSEMELQDNPNYETYNSE
ncbi:hypothetical protein LSH36_569g01003 [Paralvinella palmiformis]|uniref:C-type lectin domain-containing protein n=1 Tax=Paralvinella palmiformis TaxID=53620 RepID=A0AAD9MWV8_9ANNE|nr:hypothetical protein LSH36_569g01003 [Paralvinella palmiformis]